MNITYRPKAFLKCQTIGLTRCFPYLLLKTCCRNESELCSATEGKHTQHEHSPREKASSPPPGRQDVLDSFSHRQEGIKPRFPTSCVSLLSCSVILRKAAIFASLVGVLWACLQATPFRHPRRGPPELLKSIEPLWKKVLMGASDSQASPSDKILTLPMH